MTRNALLLAAIIGAIVLSLLGYGHLADDVIEAVPPVEEPAPPVEAAPPAVEPTPDTDTPSPVEAAPEPA